MNYCYIKKILDLYVSIFLLLFLCPFFLIVSMIVYSYSGYKIFFKQPRVGMNDAIFYIVKFKTMLDLRDPFGNPLSDNERLTSLGRIVRAFSLDELPQLINVLKGQMSLVGPRPLLVEYLPLYNDRQRRRHAVKPGITGWAQVNGRNAISWQEKFELDVWYVENQSFWLDLKILWLTVLKVIQREGISQNGQATIEKFTGNT